VRLAGVTLVLIGVMAVQAAAQGLPSRRGMAQAAPGLWIDAAATGAEIAAIRDRIAGASVKVAGRLGAAQPVEWWICTTKACDSANGMKARGITYGASLITLNANAGRDPGVYVHELTHATLHGALPLGGLFSTALPLWFDEGVAVILSGEPPAAAKKAACAKPQKGRLPQNAREFNRMAPNAKKALPVYTRSACAVRDWMADGNRLRDLLPMLRAGRRLP